LQRLAIAFTGTAPEFRRMWLRNLLFNLLLTGFFTPIARRRVAQYFASRTLLDGSPIESHSQPGGHKWKLLVIGALYLASRIAADFGWGPPLPLLVIAGVLLVPYFWGSMAHARIAGTRWRDVALHWDASWADIYRASWPLYVIGLPWAAVVSHIAPPSPGTQPDIDPQVLALVGAAAVVAFPFLARLAFNYRRLMVTRTRAGGEPVFWDARFGPYLSIWLGTAGAVIASVLPVVALLRYAFFGSFGGPGELTGPAAIGLPLASALLALLLSAPARAWHEARMFVLLWDGLRVGEYARFECTLRPADFVRLRARNTLRTLTTLGAHRPVGIVDEQRMKCEAVTLVTK
jgi:uncharacterized membrane protein YjgN (DUF898 family)